MRDFDHILNWKLLRGSHEFPGPTGGTCINEAAVVACGFPYQRVGSVRSMPDCFSRPICQLAMRLNDEATDGQRQQLIPFVTRLACADTPKIERERERYIGGRIYFDPFYPVAPYRFDFHEGLGILEGALAIGRQADPLNVDEVATRLDAVRAVDAPAKKRIGFWPAKMKGWLGLQQDFEKAD